MRHSRNAGFTLIELLIVVVILGILSSMAIPAFRSTKGKAYMASMKSDLRNLESAEEAYAFVHNAYTNVPGDLEFNTSQGVTLTITTATASGWSAKVTNPLSSPQTCAVFVGDAPALAPATNTSEISCQ
ncbi:MAG TPA: type II secretion system protein [Gemmatimonadaceae bacterium]|nr:type II secretion system protein [Gemmatimonadaceae bacterium]